MDAPLITLDDAANTTDVYAFVSQRFGQKYLTRPSPSIRTRSRASAPTSTTSTTTCCTRSTSRPAQTSPTGGPTYQLSVPVRHHATGTATRSCSPTSAWSANVDDARAEPRCSPTRSPRSTGAPGRATRLGTGIVPPNNQGNATPFYNQGDNGENPAKDGVADDGAARPLHRADDRHARRTAISRSPASAKTGSTPTSRRSSIC